MADNKWLKKSFALLKSMQDDYGVIYFSSYFCNIEGENEDDSIFVIELLDVKKTLGKVIDMINVETKEDYQNLKSEIEKINEFNVEISEAEFRHRIKSIGQKINTIDDRERPMLAYEIRVDEYNAIRLCELCDGRFYYEKYQGNAKANGKTKFLFNQNMSYEIAFINNMQQLINGNNGYRIKASTNIESEEFVENKVKALEGLFNEAKEDAHIDLKEISQDEVVINIDRNNFIEKHKIIAIENEENDFPFQDYLLIKILKQMYGNYWTSEVSLSRLNEKDLLKEFKENNPEVFEEIFKTMLIEVSGYIKHLGQ